MLKTAIGSASYARSELASRLKVFVSHSSKESDVAERLALALREAGHDVFFDRRSLDPGEGYHRRIRDEIARCDLFVFLVSKASLREDSYARSELELAAQRFHHPAGRVLPVMVESVPTSELTPFLAAVTVFDPVGDVVAETANEVEKFARRRSTRRVWSVAAAVLVLVTAGATTWYASQTPSEPAFAGDVPIALERALEPGGPLRGRLRALPASIGSRVRFVAQDDSHPRDAIAFVAVEPHELWTMDAHGDPRAVARLPEEPTALAASSDCIAVGSAGNLRLFVGPTEEPRGPYELDAVRVSREEPGTYSVAPRSLAVRRAVVPAGDGAPERVEVEVWARTQDADHEPFLTRFDLDRETFSFPFLMGIREEVSSLSAGLTLRAIDGDVYGVTSETTPGSIVKWFDGDYLVAGGHDVELVSCANEIAAAPGGRILLIDCERRLVRAERREGTIVFLLSLGQLALPEDRMQTWEAQKLSVCRGRVLVAISLMAQQPRYEAVVTRLFSWTSNEGVRLLAAIERCETVALATLESSGLAVLRTVDGRHQAVRIDYSGP